MAREILDCLVGKYVEIVPIYGRLGWDDPKTRIPAKRREFRGVLGGYDHTFIKLIEAAIYEKEEFDAQRRNIQEFVLNRDAVGLITPKELRERGED